MLTHHQRAQAWQCTCSLTSAMKNSYYYTCTWHANTHVSMTTISTLQNLYAQCIYIYHTKVYIYMYMYMYRHMFILGYYKLIGKHQQLQMYNFYKSCKELHVYTCTLYRVKAAVYIYIVYYMYVLYIVFEYIPVP